MKSTWSAATAILICTLSQPAVADEEVVKILAPWEAEGKMYRIEPTKIQFVGEFEGIMCEFYLHCAVGLRGQYAMW